MNNREYFVFAVIIALIIPVILGGIYFADLYKKKENNNYVEEEVREVFDEESMTID